jgi:hypothetical protein
VRPASFRGLVGAQPVYLALSQSTDIRTQSHDPVHSILRRTSAASSSTRASNHKWATTALYSGCLLPAGKHMQFDPYYEHQNITGKRPNQQLNQFGLVLNLYL